MSNSIKFLGSGIAFPLQLDDSGKVVVTAGVDLIKSSILNIINWPQRHRFFLEQYGCRIEECLEDPNDAVNLNLIKRYITDSIQTWEKRVEINPSSIKLLGIDDTTIKLEMRLYIVSTKREETFIFPFYKSINY